MHNNLENHHQSCGWVTSYKGCASNFIWNNFKKKQCDECFSSLFETIYKYKSVTYFIGLMVLNNCWHFCISDDPLYTSVDKHEALLLNTWSKDTIISASRLGEREWYMSNKCFDQPLSMNKVLSCYTIVFSAGWENCLRLLFLHVCLSLSLNPLMFFFISFWILARQQLPIFLIKHMK